MWKLFVIVSKILYLRRPTSRPINTKTKMENNFERNISRVSQFRKKESQSKGQREYPVPRRHRWEPTRKGIKGNIIYTREYEVEW